MINLSHTAKEKYLDSPRAYYLHYLLNLREEKCGSALFFGNAMDNALNVLLLERDLNKAIIEFNKQMRTFTYNNETLDILKTDKIKYSKSDVDDSLIPEGTPDELRAWASLLTKGTMFLETYEKEILPKIKKVLAVQQHIEIGNEAGDKIVGFIDFICEWEDGRIVIFDNKTSSVDYAKDKLQDDAPQLATYKESKIAQDLNVTHQGYIVISKKVRKKDPRVRIEVIIDQIPETLVEKTFADYDKVLKCIKMGEFKCSGTCDRPWGKCPYKSYCETDGADLTGLVKIAKKT